MIGYTDEALEQVRALRHHYETLARDAAIRALDRALADSEAKIERSPSAGLPAPRPYPQACSAGVGMAQVGALLGCLPNRTSPGDCRRVLRDSEHPRPLVVRRSRSEPPPIVVDLIRPHARVVHRLPARIEQTADVQAGAGSENLRLTLIFPAF